MNSFRDSQKSSVYAWENVAIAPKDTNIVPFENIQTIVNWIWQNEGLKYPPLVAKLPKQKRVSGDGKRTCVRFKEKTYTWIVLHELAHAMTSNAEGESNFHGSLFMGVYIQLVSRYLNIPYGQLVESAEARGLKVKLDARPVFLES